MTSIISQKHSLLGSREFQLAEEEIQCSIKSPFKTESSSVVYEVLSTKPVLSGSVLSFISKVNNEPLVELFLDKPNKQEFDLFIEAFKQKIIDYDLGRFRAGENGVDVNIVRLSEATEILQKHMDQSEIKLLLSALIELKAKPDDINLQSNVAEAFNDLGFVKNQVLIYAPYLTFLFCGNR